MTGSKAARIVGWVLSVLIAVFMIGVSARGKFVDFPGKEDMFAKMGFTIELMQKVGVVEIVCALLFLIPQTSFVGAILLTGYLGGATETHLRIGEPFWIPVVFGVVVWIAIGLRRPEVFKMACCCGCAKSPPPA